MVRPIPPDGRPGDRTPRSAAVAVVSFLVVWTFRHPGVIRSIRTTPLPERPGGTRILSRRAALAQVEPMGRLS